MKLQIIVGIAISVMANSNAYCSDITSAVPFLSKLNEKTFRARPKGTDLQPELMIIPYPDDNAISVGEGIDLITGRRKLQRCITFSDTTKTNFYIKESSFSEVTDEESLWRKLSMSISARASYAGYSGGGSYSSVVETKTSSKHITTIAKAFLKTYVDTITTSTENSTSIDLTDKAFDLAKNTPAEFRRICGDGFVVQITYGASLYGILQFSTNDFQKKETTKIAVDGSGPSGVFKAEANKQMDEIFDKKVSEVNIQAIEQGGAASKIPTSRQDLIDNFESIATRAKDNERPLFVTVLRYNVLPRGRDRFYVEVVSGLEAMVKRSLRLRTLLNEARDAHVHRRAFEDGPAGDYAKHDYVFVPPLEDGRRTTAGLQSFGDELQTLIDDVNAQISLCIEQTSTANCMVPRLIDMNDYNFRAEAALPINDIAPATLQKIVTASNSGISIVKTAAACLLARVIQQKKIYAVDRIRCLDDNECSNSTILKEAEGKVYDGLIVDESDCSSPLVVAETDKMEK
ncbi:hypothetical protein [Mycoplana sp. MJR14]|uniref:hypothetical protein n=1 Tax=Mycoplana sp. MJR14 TaxID=3032583 RepID=UPI0023DC2D33|nr:hypothetical protein [Mycoplana sp. MJR14]MDF1635579.1 hypothetical protein [Mycoplana sp. MJR14]